MTLSSRLVIPLVAKDSALLLPRAPDVPRGGSPQQELPLPTQLEMVRFPVHGSPGRPSLLLLSTPTLDL